MIKYPKILFHMSPIRYRITDISTLAIYRRYFLIYRPTSTRYIKVAEKCFVNVDSKSTELIESQEHRRLSTWAAERVDDGDKEVDKDGGD